MPVEHVPNPWGEDDSYYAQRPFIFSLYSLDFYLHWQCVNSTCRLPFRQHIPYLSNRTARSVALQATNTHRHWLLSAGITSGRWQGTAGQTGGERSLPSCKARSQEAFSAMCQMTDRLEIHAVKWLFSFPLRHLSNDFSITLQMKKARGVQKHTFSLCCGNSLKVFLFSSCTYFFLMVILHDLGNFILS